MSKTGSPDLTTVLQQAGAAYTAGDAEALERHMLAAWDLLPEPKTGHDYGGTLAVTITEHYRDQDQPAQAAHWLAVAREAYGPDPDPHTEFLAGTVHWAAGEIDEALAVFTGLYERWHTRPFQDEPPQYLEAVLAHRAGEPVIAEPVDHRMSPDDDGELLPDDVADRVAELCDLGDEAADDGELDAAIATWTSALELLPEPVTDWGEATWLYASLGDVHLRRGDDAAARAALFEALNSPDGQATGFVHYLLGLSFLRTDDARAIDHLLRAYALEGADIFTDDGETGAWALQTIEGLV